MNEGFVELLVKRKNRLGDTVLKCCLAGLTIGFAFMGLFTVFTLLIFGALIFGVLFYFVRMRSNVEYEYTYIDKELTIDKIMNQAKRKRMEKLDIERMEIMAPINSHQLDSYKNRTGKVLDYSSQFQNEPDNRYLLFIDGGKKVIIEPNQELITAIKNNAPRKVFLD